MRRLIIIVTTVAVTTFALSGCATPEQRLRTGLTDAGLSKPVSACMARKMVHQLSLTELQRISSLASLKDARLQELSLAEMFDKLRALNDSHILSVTTKAGLSCAIDPSR